MRLTDEQKNSIEVVTLNWTPDRTSVLRRDYDVLKTLQGLKLLIFRRVFIYSNRHWPRVEIRDFFRELTGKPDLEVRVERTERRHFGTWLYLWLKKNC